jgi:hypothetical protein
MMSVAATLFEHRDFQGQSFTSDPGSQYLYHWNTWGGHNDFFSSMRALGTGGRGHAFAFEHIDFSGRFAALNVPATGSESYWSYFGDAFNDQVSSSLVVSRYPDSRESQVALRQHVAPQFTALLDQRLQGRPIARNVDPRIYATFFPEWGHDFVYLTIDQDLRTSTLRLNLLSWPGYAVNVKYYIRFFVGDDRRLHATCEYSRVWVEAGPLSKEISDAVAPGLHGAKTDVSEAFEDAVASLPGRAHADVYLLPGGPPDMNQFGYFAQFDDDVTLVVVD